MGFGVSGKSLQGLCCKNDSDPTRAEKRLQGMRAGERGHLGESRGTRATKQGRRDGDKETRAEQWCVEEVLDKHPCHPVSCQSATSC